MLDMMSRNGTSANQTKNRRQKTKDLPDAHEYHHNISRSMLPEMKKRNQQITQAKRRNPEMHAFLFCNASTLYQLRRISALKRMRRKEKETEERTRSRESGIVEIKQNRQVNANDETAKSFPAGPIEAYRGEGGMK